MRACLAMIWLLLSSGAAVSDDARPKAQLARKMFSAFQCSTFAEVAGKADDQRRLFELGLSAGRTFLAAMGNKEIPEHIVREEVPLIGVVMLMGGPTDDFVIGRIFENAATEARKRVSPSNPSFDDVRKFNAESEFDSSNCDLIQ